MKRYFLVKHWAATYTLLFSVAGSEPRDSCPVTRLPLSLQHPHTLSRVTHDSGLSLSPEIHLNLCSNMDPLHKPEPTVLVPGSLLPFGSLVYDRGSCQPRQTPCISTTPPMSNFYCLERSLRPAFSLHLSDHILFPGFKLHRLETKERERKKKHFNFFIHSRVFFEYLTLLGTL